MSGPGLSFKFSKTSEQKVLLDSKLSDSSTKDNNDERDFIKDVKDKAMIGSIKPQREQTPSDSYAQSQKL